MILAFETGKWSTDNHLNGMMNALNGKYCRYFRDTVRGQKIEPARPLPPDTKHRWLDLEKDLQDQKANAYVFCGFMRGVEKIYKQALERNIDFYFLDHPYFFRREAIRTGKTNSNTKSLFRRLVKNDFNISKITDINPDKYNYFRNIKPEKFVIKDWKKTGSNILVFPPSYWMCHTMGLDYEKLLENTINEIKKHTDRNIVIRHKKQDGVNNPVSLTTDLDNAWAVVSMQSNAANESIMYGVPSFTIFNKYSSAVPMSLQDLSKIETPFYPDNRYEWLCNLCNHIFTIDEITSGKAFRYVEQQ